VLQVTTSSGGSDQLVLIFNRDDHLGPLAGEGVNLTPGLPPEGPNPTRGRFALNAPWINGVGARLTIFDVAGRQVAVVRGRPGTQLIWEGKGTGGRAVRPAVYLYRMEVGRYRRDGKVVVIK
jgi:hypothetical protein